METRAVGDVTIAILSDVHYAGPAERARGDGKLRAPPPVAEVGPA